MAGNSGRFIFGNKLDNKEIIDCLENEYYSMLEC